MKRTVARVLAVLALAAGGTAVAVAPAAASDMPGIICTLNQNTWLRAAPDSIVLRTLSAGRGFRMHIVGSAWSGWHYGHGAEAPEIDGWIPVGNCG
jgi:hypothetical protein